MRSVWAALLRCVPRVGVPCLAAPAAPRTRLRATQRSR